jgi:Mob1/phocein family
MNAPQYIDSVMSWIGAQLDNEYLFPVKSGNFYLSLLNCHIYIYIYHLCRHFYLYSCALIRCILSYKASHGCIISSIQIILPCLGASVFFALRAHCDATRRSASQYPVPTFHDFCLSIRSSGQERIFAYETVLGETQFRLLKHKNWN